MFRFALVDIETTGLNVIYDRITEISVRIISSKGIENSWHSLINPNRPIPAAISALTGITQDLIANSPDFEEIAQDLLVLLHDNVLVAHNARFDFGFLKNAFKRCGFTYQSPVLCTIKLMKQLYPQLPKYNLGALAEFFQINHSGAHRAQKDVDTLHQLLIRAFNDFSPEKVITIAKLIYQKSSIPSRLATDIKSFPDTAGVYIFYSNNSSVPLYIGKSINLRQRIMSHFQGDYNHAKEFTIAQQVERVEIIPTAGELSALLLESKLIKEQMPIYNRRLRRKTQLVGFRLMESASYLTISIVRELVEHEDDLKSQGIYGAFRSIHAAKRKLLALIKEFGLCQKLCNIESTNDACFSYQLKKCKGACIGEETPEVYNQRVQAAVSEFTEEVWPFPGAIAIKEQCTVNKITEFLVFHQWRHLGSFNDESGLSQWIDLSSENNKTHYDGYKILLNYLKNKTLSKNIIELTC